jgi:outer membrane protein OmpA-like peptidoglycan-associated protein
MNPDLKVMITGHADYTASEQYNEKLGMRRAEAVKDHLVKVYGVDPARLSTETKGETDPMANNPNKDMNRRVDFSVIK